MGHNSLSRLSRERLRTAWLFLVPMLCVLLLVAAWPLGRTIWFSLSDAQFSDLPAAQWIGLENYFFLLGEPDFWRATGNTVKFALLSVSIETILGLVIALMLNARFVGRGLLRAAILVPWAIPTIVSAKMWNWMFNDVFGIVNALLQGLGIIEAPIAWTADPDLAFFSIVFVDVWKTTPFMALLLLAGLQILPEECYKAAKIDGIHPIKVFFHITLPLLKPALSVAIIFRLLDAFRVFDVIYVMSGNNQYTMSLSVFARQQIVDFQDVSLGSAAATLLFAFIAFFSVLYMTMSKIGKDEY